MEIRDSLSGEESFEFDWDEGNSAKVKWIKEIRHPDISIAEIESVFDDEKLLVYSALAIHSEIRYCAVGKSNKNRILSVIFAWRNHKIRPINAWKTKGQKRSDYLQQKT